MEWIFAWIAHYGYLALFTLLVLGIVGLPVPDETLLTFAGYLIFKHEFALAPTLLAAFLGSVCGISLSYGLGRSLGTYLVERIGYLLHLDPETLGSVRAWYDRRGKYTLLFGYFVPGFRHLTAYVAGASKLPLAVFAPFAYAGALLWSVSFIALGYMLGEEWARLSGAIHRGVAIGAGMIFLVLALIFILGRRKRRQH